MAVNTVKDTPHAREGNKHKSTAGKAEAVAAAAKLEQKKSTARMSTGGKPPRPMQQAKDSELNVVFISKGKKLPQLSKGSPKSAPPMPEAMHMYNTEVSYSPTNHEHALRYLQIGLEHIAKKGGHYGYDAVARRFKRL